MEPPTFYTVQEVAALLKVSAAGVRRLIRRGQLKALRVGKSYRVRPAQIEDFASQAVGIHAPRPRAKAPTTTQRRPRAKAKAATTAQPQPSRQPRQQKKTVH